MLSDCQYRYMIDILEKVQRRFTKRLSGLRHLSYADRLQVGLLSLESLEGRRVIYDLILVYKILHGLTDCTLSHNLTLQEFNKTRGHPYKLVKSFCSHDIHKHFYTNRVVDLWNNLPNDVISAKSLHSFKCKLRNMLNFSF